MPHMLIVDDEPDICDCLQHFFRGRGFAVSCAFSGEEALEWLDRAPIPIDVLLVDILLPGIHGIEVLKHAKQRCPSVTVVMVTGLDEDGTRVEAESCGAAGYVTKPFDFSDDTWAPVFSRP